MDDAGDERWHLLPGSRRAIQVDSWAGLSALLFDPPVGLLLLPVVALVAGLIKASNRTGGVEIAPESRRLRRGRRKVEASDVYAARLLIDVDNYSALDLQLDAPRLAFRIQLHDGHSIVLDDRARELLLDLLPHTSIAMPESQYDPKGKFAKYNFPSHITKAEAITLMEEPPGPGDPLPIPG
ncbi:hypothetical protein [Antiquaquibacter soli]|uniref:Uncharacterized protein n=1 Tax=Antiquaquibacter soli TaxID=3064523 RepID=A0ABT9BLG7_9MICO|nr:hypothetical protein [Protaetiibacter sp. WY-16]MDO7881424.1 hypothetical protein [Protaetiibacter sp. WY-16]